MIYKGWKNYVGFDKLPKEQRALAAERVADCLVCPHMRQNKAIMLAEKTFGLKTRDGYQCGLCGCSIYAKATIEAAKCPDKLPRW